MIIRRFIWQRWYTAMIYMVQLAPDSFWREKSIRETQYPLGLLNQVKHVHVWRKRQ